MQKWQVVERANKSVRSFFAKSMPARVIFVPIWIEALGGLVSDAAAALILLASVEARGSREFLIRTAHNRAEVMMIATFAMLWILLSILVMFSF